MTEPSPAPAASARAHLLGLKNLGPSSVDKLMAIGIRSRDDIARLGAARVFLLLRDRFPVSRTMLWALQGALLGLPYYQIPGDIRQELLLELSAHAPDCSNTGRRRVS